MRTTGDPAVLAAVLDALPAVEYAEVDRPMHALATPNDPRYRELYGLNNVGQTGGLADADIDEPEGWDLAGMGAFPGTGGVKVGIVDTGITQTHEDLAGKTVDCGQSAGGAISVGACADDNGQGTHVAGTIAATANNGRGVTGVAFNSPLSICPTTAATASFRARRWPRRTSRASPRRAGALEARRLRRRHGPGGRDTQYSFGRVNLAKAAA